MLMVRRVFDRLWPTWCLDTTLISSNLTSHHGHRPPSLLLNAYFSSSIQISYSRFLLSLVLDFILFVSRIQCWWLPLITFSIIQWFLCEFGSTYV
ncbi:hypothetical protein L1987_44677 [Smallanthus sonchifolius]|uniref:Uncharacterized protein n=1 Tax=Smallanthus sonchifolius TaxID=185202 RepID=A0ACB9GQ49_9ASTR|nr:hypothetical protein L1987_44677 [Smallanthus sonchifolius]